MGRYLERHPGMRGAAALLRRYFDHHVARDSAALTYYLLFALFPLLIFLNNLVGVFAIDLTELLEEVGAVIPRDVVTLAEQYLAYVSRSSSTTMMWFSLVFTFYFPYRAVNALFLSVRKAYDVPPPTGFVRGQLRAVLYTILLVITLVITPVVSAVGRRSLEFLAQYVYLSEYAIRRWTQLRFVFLGAVLFFMIVLLYALALDAHSIRRGILPGVLAALAAWITLSMLFSLYVEHAANYSLIYGSIGAIIVLLLWLYLSATMLIMGAEFNSVLLTIRESEAKNA